MLKCKLFFLFTVLVFWMHSNAQTAPVNDKKEIVKAKVEVQITDMTQRIDDHHFVKAEEKELLQQLDEGELSMIEDYSSKSDYPICISDLMKNKDFNFADFKLYKIADFENVDADYNAYNLGPATCAIIEVTQKDNKKTFARCKSAFDFYIVINVWGIKEINGGKKKAD